MRGLVFLQLHNARENLATIIAWMRMRLVQPMLLKPTGSKETLGAQCAFEFLFVKLTMLFFLIHTFKSRGATLTFVHLGWRVEVNRHKHACCTLLAYNHTRRGGGGGVC